MSRRSPLPLLVLVAAACAPAEAPDPGPTPEEIAAGLQPAVQIEGEAPLAYALAERMAHYDVPGVSVAVMDGGRVAWARAWGVADKETGAEVTPATLFQAASISKPVAALAALSLVEEGVLALDAPVNDFLTGWKVPDNGFTADSAVTLRGLLTHSAGTTVWGFPGYRKDQPFSEERTVAANVQVLEGEGNTPAVRVYKVPGTSWQYSGGGYTVMEQLVEDVTGLPIDEAVRLRVLGPAGMARSTYQQPLPEARWPEAARGHRGDGTEVEGEWHTYPEQAAAGLWTTPSDLLALSAHLLRVLSGEETGGVVSREMLEAMLSPNHAGDSAFSNWGLGFALQGEGETARFGHGGSNEGFRAQWTVFRNRGQGAVVMTNGDRGGALAAEILRSVAAAYGWPGDAFAPRVRARKVLDGAALAAFDGSFALEARPEMAITVRAGDGHLVVTVPGQGDFVLHAAAEAEDEFFDPEDASVIRFVRDADGRVVAATNTAGARFVRKE